MRDERPLMDGDDTLSPVDLPGSRTIGGRPLAWTAAAIYVAAAILAITNASAIHGWAVELPPGDWTAKLVQATKRWETATAPLGRPHATMHGWWKAAQAARFGGERPDE